LAVRSNITFNNEIICCRVRVEVKVEVKVRVGVRDEGEG
jgi:hypothetical protein